MQGAQAVEILQRREGAHADAIRHPGPGGSAWRKAIKRTTMKLLAEEGILTENPARVANIMTAYFAVRYADERLPKYNISEIAREALEDRHAERVAKKDKKGIFRDLCQHTEEENRLLTPTI